MFACEGMPVVIATLMFGAGNAFAQPTARLDLLARESAQWMVGSVEAGPAVATPTLLAVALLAALAAAFLGGFFGMRRLASVRAARGRTRGFSSGAEVLDRLQHVLSDVERVAGEIRTPPPSDAPVDVATSRNAPPVVFARTREADGDARRVRTVTGQPTRTDRFDEARGLLRDGMDPAGVQSRTGLRLAEIDLLRAAPRVTSRSYA